MTNNTMTNDESIMNEAARTAACLTFAISSNGGPDV
jgi:hypothetical protein